MSKPLAVFQAAAAPRQPLLTVKDIAALLGCTTRTVWRLRDSGGMPQPLKAGAMVRWRSEDIERWIQAGCPRSRRR